MMLWQRAGLLPFCGVADVGCQVLSPENSIQMLAETGKAPVSDGAVSLLAALWDHTKLGYPMLVPDWC